MYRSAPDSPGAVPAPAIEARLEPDAIGVAQDTVIGMASSAPAGTMAATLAALAVASAYGSGPVLIVTALPMLVIANSYRRLNLWSTNCGASFEWVGCAINPYLGFITGWLMIAGYVIGTVAEVVVLGPSVLAVCLPGHDHTVGTQAGCPGCGRLKTVCTGWRACSARRSRFAPLRLAGLRLRRAWRRMRSRPGPSCCGTPGRCSR
jgi:amino acid transporter